MTRSTSNRYLTILTGLLMLVSIVNVADKELLAPVADAVKADLGMSDTQLGMVRSAVFLAALLGQLFWGPLSDRWVRKNIIVIGTVLWSALTWMTAFVGSFPQLLMARASMSFAEGCFNPSSYALLTDTAPKKQHGMMLGLMSRRHRGRAGAGKRHRYVTLAPAIRHFWDHRDRAWRCCTLCGA